MRKILLGLTVVAVTAAAAYFVVRPKAEAETVVLYKDPQCGCCEEYANYLRHNGFAVTVRPTANIYEMSSAAGIPEDLQGCHLAYIGDYFVSGDVPLGTVNKMLSERPAIKGVTLPGMPSGSPGMSGAKTEPFQTYAIDKGQPRIYAVE